MLKRLMEVFCLLGALGSNAMPFPLNQTVYDWRANSTGGATQLLSFEKQALALVKRIPASELDEKLPGEPFADWFKQLGGPQAGIVWQLTECGDSAGASVERDAPACAEANALLPDGRKVIVAIAVGTFKKGLSREPAFYRAVIERDERFYTISRLCDLPAMLSAPESLPVTLPAIAIDQAAIKPLLPAFPQARPIQDVGGDRLLEVEEGESPPPPAERPAPQQKASAGLVSGNAIIRVKPAYPVSARNMNASGKVEVQITIAEDGRVTEAKAISGHPALRGLAVEAARKWVFEPTTLNGAPVKAQSILTFVFTSTAQ